jgi:hypothetical protein
MQDFVSDRSNFIREYFGIDGNIDLLNPGTRVPEISREMADHLKAFNMEWHVIPSENALPFDGRYLDRMYPTSSMRTGLGGRKCEELRLAFARGHSKHQGRIVAVETTQKPAYLPDNKQKYGTLFGFENTADPFARYLGKASFVNGTRYAHNFLSLREFVRVVHDDWESRSLLPDGYRVRICPPGVLNFVGTLFHREWSETAPPELGFYRDANGNATCYAIGCNGPGDFSYVHHIEGEGEWTLLGFRLALVQE